MFTGIIEECGKVSSLNKGEGSNAGNLDIEIDCKSILKDLKSGDSVAVDGVCQTVTKITEKSFSVTAIQETLNLTNFNYYKLGSLVNLERPLRLSDRLDGHIVQGHVDSVAELIKINDYGGSKELFYKLKNPELSKYIIHKGSITVSGISLTVASIKNDVFSVAIIPKTFEITNLSEAKISSLVNIEVDMLSKYLEKLMLPA